MEEESFNDVMGHAPVYSSGIPGVSVTNPAEFKEWHGRVRRAHEREVREHTMEYDIDGLSDRELAEHGLVRLPVDADGKVIRVGDTLDGHGETTVVGRLTLDDDGLFMTCENGLWFDFTAFTHHHAPTVEDVLREFTDEVWNRCCEGATASDSGIDELVAECAAKLRLADDGKEL